LIPYSKKRSNDIFPKFQILSLQFSRINELARPEFQEIAVFPKHLVFDPDNPEFIQMGFSFLLSNHYHYSNLCNHFKTKLIIKFLFSCTK